jgi:hypothetical protein
MTKTKPSKGQYKMLTFIKSSRYMCSLLSEFFYRLTYLVINFFQLDMPESTFPFEYSLPNPCRNKTLICNSKNKRTWGEIYI